MKQKFYLVSYFVDDNLHTDKIFLQYRDAVKYGKILAAKNPNYSVALFSQDITKAGKLKMDRILTPYTAI